MVERWTAGPDSVELRGCGTGPAVLVVGRQVEPVRRALADRCFAVSVDPLADPAVLDDLAASVVVGVRAGAGAATGIARALGADLVLFEPAAPPVRSAVVPRLDGSHLVSLWAEVRDEEVRRGSDLDDPDVLDRVHGAVVDLVSGVDRWPPTPADPAAPTARTLDELLALVAPSGPAARVPPFAVRPGTGWATYVVPTSVGGIVVRHRDRGTGGTPLVLLHSSPGSGGALLPLADALSATRPVLVPDTAGNGGSDAPGDPTTIEALAALALEAVAPFAPGPFDAYGAHTGACLAVELALAAPERVRSVVTDGIGLWSEAEVADAEEHHFADITPRWDGTHLLVAWGMLLDGSRWFPWHHRSPAHRRDVPDPDPAALQAAHARMLHSGTTYPLSYRAAFRHPTRERLARLARTGVRLGVGRRASDPLDPMSPEVLALVPGSLPLPFGDGEDADAIAAFLR